MQAPAPTQAIFSGNWQTLQTTFPVINLMTALQLVKSPIVANSRLEKPSKLP
jgi:hypothetical protein